MPWPGWPPSRCTAPSAIAGSKLPWSTRAGEKIRPTPAGHCRRCAACTHSSACRNRNSCAARAGMRSVAGAVASIDASETGRISSLRLESGDAIEGDLFVDCVGLSETERDDWSAWLPCDRMACASAPPLANPPPMTQTTASEAGWTWRVPLAAATAVGHVYCSMFVDDDAALAKLASVAPEAGDARVVARFHSGRRRWFWERNCVALGQA